MPAKRKTNRAAPLGRRKPSSTKSSRSKPARAKSSSKPARKDLHCPIVGIGGRAGGVAANTGLLPRLPSPNEKTFLLVQHPPPHHARQIARLFCPTTRTPVAGSINNTKP